MLRAALAAICAFTLLATVYLTLSLLILRPPRANYQEWTVMASLFVAQSVLTLLAFAGGSSASWIRWVVLVGGGAIIWAGASWAFATVWGPHFEGYALVLGSVLVLQGALTLVVFARQRPLPALLAGWRVG